jgi:sulfur-carrier protein
MQLSVQLFARARDLAGTPVVELTLPEGATVGELKRELGRRCPELAPLSGRLLVAVGQAYARDGDSLPAGAEIACFPPVSGG